jgi:hypothetical protein
MEVICWQCQKLEDDQCHWQWEISTNQAFKNFAMGNFDVVRELFLGHTIPHFMNTVTFTLTWNWGGAMSVTVCEALTLQEVASEWGFATKSAVDSLFISRGRILEPYFTLHYHRIKSGQKVIAYTPNGAQASGIPPPKTWRLPMSPQAIEKITQIEAFRLFDMQFKHSEAKREFLNLVGTAWGAIDKSASEKVEPIREETVVIAAAQISVLPLPLPINPVTRYRRICKE